MQLKKAIIDLVCHGMIRDFIIFSGISLLNNYTIVGDFSGRRGWLFAIESYIFMRINAMAGSYCNDVSFFEQGIVAGNFNFRECRIDVALTHNDSEVARFKVIMV